jgi:hypothetical protein
MRWALGGLKIGRTNGMATDIPLHVSLFGIVLNFKFHLLPASHFSFFVFSRPTPKLATKIWHYLYHSRIVDLDGYQPLSARMCECW